MLLQTDGWRVIFAPLPMSSNYLPGDIIRLEKLVYLYELMDDHGLVFYVGVSSDPAYRFKTHANPKHCDRPIVCESIVACISPQMRIVSVHATRREAETAEAQRIKEVPGLINEKGIGRDPVKARAAKEREKLRRRKRMAAMGAKKRRILTDLERKEALRAKSRAKSRKRTTEYYRARKIRRALRDAAKLLNA